MPATHRRGEHLDRDLAGPGEQQLALAELGASGPADDDREAADQPDAATLRDDPRARPVDQLLARGDQLRALVSAGREGALEACHNELPSSLAHPRHRIDWSPLATDHRLLPVSLVIPTLDRQQIARETVESILAGDTLPRELILADQSRVPVDPPPMPAGVDLIHLRLTNASLSGGRNAAIAAAGCDMLVFIDDDVQVESDWLRRLVEPLAEAPERTAVTGAVLARPGAEELGHVPSIAYGRPAETYCGRIYADLLFPNNMAIRRSAFDEVGTFDERLGAGKRLSVLRGQRPRFPPARGRL